MKFSKEDVLKFLPHRDPFLFIDSIENIILPSGLHIEELTVENYKPLIGGRVEARFFVDPELSCFQGHFPGMPIFPGVLQVEMMAQSCAFLLTACQQYELDQSQIEVAFMSVDEVRFRKKVIPPMDLKITSILKKVRGMICQYECEVYHGEDVVSQAKIMASLKFINQK